jgi:hypothetical protein
MSSVGRSSISEEWPALRLRELVEVLKTKKRDEWRQAEQQGRLSEFIKKHLWLWRIHESYWEVYHNYPLEFQFECNYERGLDKASKFLNETYQMRNQREQLPGRKDYGVVWAILALRSPQVVTRRLKEVQIKCLSGAVLCMGLSARSLIGRRFGSAMLLAASAIDLQTISYNCYERRYGDLYLQQLSGDVNRFCDTSYAFTKSVLGLTPIEANPLFRLQRQVNWDILLTDTIAKDSFEMVSLFRAILFL